MAEILSSARAVFGLLIGALAVAALPLAWALFELAPLGVRPHLWRHHRRDVTQRRRGW